MLPPNKSPIQSHHTAISAMRADSKEIATSETFSDSTLLEFFEREIGGGNANANAHYASELVDILKGEYISLHGVDTTIHYEKLQPFLKSKESRKAALKIACYVSGNLMKNLDPYYRKRDPVYYFRIAAELGFMPALKPLSNCYLNGEGLTINYNTDISYFAVEILNAASLHNTHAPAQTDNADMNVLLQALFETKDIRATYQLAILNEQLRSYDAAYNFLTIAVTENCPDAVRKMGEMYFKGDINYGIKKDEEHGEFLLIGAAIELNSVEAKRVLRHIYLGGKGKNAHSFYSKSQENPDPQTILDHCTMYEKGWGGLSKDLNKAHEILLSGSDAGLAEVSFHLAILYLKKNYITLDDFSSLMNFQKQDAYPFLIKAADQGYWPAAFAVGKAYFHDLSLREYSSEQEKSDKMAMAEKYLNMANKGGCGCADNYLHTLQRKLRKLLVPK